MEDFRVALLQADPALSKFDPLPRIIYHDDFSRSLNGWSTLVGNYEHTMNSLLPGYRDLRPPMLSNLTMWDTGSAGAISGPYALKLATRPQRNHMAVSIKRLTWRKLGRVQLECYLTYKPEPSELQLGELDVKAFGVLFDIQDDEMRWMPHLRYLNAIDGKPAAGHVTNQETKETPAGKWQYKNRTEEFERIGDTGKTVSHWHLSPNNWLDVPGGAQTLCYNEIPTKMNWVYLKVGLDLTTRRFTDFQCNDRHYGDADLESIEFPAMPNLRNMLNVVFWVETDVDKRAFLYLDSVVLSTEGSK